VIGQFTKDKKKAKRYFYSSLGFHRYCSPQLTVYSKFVPGGNSGAADRARTDHLMLGKHLFYQLNYSRILLFIAKLELEVRFELTVLRVCNPFPWASRAF
jgi:hypothetical protein